MANNPLRLGEVYQMSNPDDQPPIDEMKDRIERAFQNLQDQITTLEARVTANGG